MRQLCVPQVKKEFGTHVLSYTGVFIPPPTLRSAGFLVMGGPIFGSKMMDYHRKTVDFEAILR